jgi:hypothetical protein
VQESHVTKKRLIISLGSNKIGSIYFGKKEKKRPHKSLSTSYDPWLGVFVFLPLFVCFSSFVRLFSFSLAYLSHYSVIPKPFSKVNEVTAAASATVLSRQQPRLIPSPRPATVRAWGACRRRSTERNRATSTTRRNRTLVARGWRHQ